MRWALLYTRSRQVPASLVALLVSTVAVWLLARDSWSLLPVSLALAAGVAVTATGLSGQDADLDRSAAISWFPRRGAHLVLIGALAAGSVLVPRLWETGLVPVEMVLRNAGGLLGLAGISAVLFGGAFGWTLPLLAFAVAVLTPPDEGTVIDVATWIFQPMEVAAATWTAAVLGVVGAGSYALFGGRH
jgi:hypothetical protein